MGSKRHQLQCPPRAVQRLASGGEGRHRAASGSFGPGLCRIRSLPWSLRPLIIPHLSSEAIVPPEGVPDSPRPCHTLGHSPRGGAMCCHVTYPEGVPNSPRIHLGHSPLRPSSLRDVTLKQNRIPSVSQVERLQHDFGSLLQACSRVKVAGSACLHFWSPSPRLPGGR